MKEIAAYILDKKKITQRLLPRQEYVQHFFKKCLYLLTVKSFLFSTMWAQKLPRKTKAISPASHHRFFTAQYRAKMTGMFPPLSHECQPCGAESHKNTSRKAAT